MGWKDTIQKVPEGGSSGWRSTIKDAPNEALESPATAATTGFMDLGGWGPRIGALGDTAMKAITGVKGPLAGGDLAELGDNYNDTRDQLQGEFATAAKAHPAISTVSKLAGKAAALAPLGAAAVSDAGLLGTGAIEGAGGVNVDKLSDIPKAAGAIGTGALSNLVAGKIVNSLASSKAGAPVMDTLRSGANSVGNGLETAGSYATRSGALGGVIGGVEGYRHGGIPGAFEGAAIGTVLGPKAGHGIAMGLKGLASVVRASPEILGKFGPILANAAARGTASLEITDKVLQETDPNYRQIRDQALGGDSQGGK